VRVSVSSAWYQYIRKHEGEVAYMYLDKKGLVTVGVGNLIDPMRTALDLPFEYKSTNKLKRPAGQRATPAEIESEWKHIKNHPNRTQMALDGHKSCRDETNLELSTLGRQRLFSSKSSSNEQTLMQTFSSWVSFPADAQLALMAMAWGLGANAGISKKFPRFTAACSKMDFDAAVADCTIKTWRPERNTASRRLLANAAVVMRNPGHYDPGILYYPTALGDEVVVV